MSKTFGFKRVEQPVPVEPEWKMCIACAFKAECYVPVGEGSAQMCWMCAHLHVDHNVPIDEIINSEACECLPHTYLPHRSAPSPVTSGFYHERPQYVGKHSERWESKKRAKEGIACCIYDHDRDGNCHIHRAGELRTALASVSTIAEDLSRRKPS